MLRSYEQVVAVLACIFMLSLAMSQTNLSIPVNHATTGTAIGGHSEDHHEQRNLRFINAKDQPGYAVETGILPAYWASSGISNGLTEQLMRRSNLAPWTMDVYPSVFTHGAWQDNDVATEAVWGLYSESPYRFRGLAGATWYWDQADWPADPQPITCAIAPSWQTTSRYIVVGLDRIGDATATHYFERSPDGGLTWEVVPNNGPALAIMPTNLATTDVAIEGVFAPDKLVTVTTQALDDNDLPLLTDHVVLHGIYWTNALRNVSPEWETVPDFPLVETWNLQISMKDNFVFGIAYLPGQSRQAVYFGDFTGNALVDWQEVPVSFTHPLPDAIPYDFEIGPMVNGHYTLLTTNSDGLYYSPNQGADWYKAENFASDAIRTPELREFSIDEDDGVHRIAIAGWYASYVGAYNPSNWEFDLQEISYDPTVIDLYQNYNQAWTGAVTGSNTINPADIALIDYSSEDEIFPDPEAVCVQVQNWFGNSASTKTIFLGRQDVNETGPVIRPFLFTNKPAVVFNRKGTAGPVAMETGGPDYLTWVEHPLFADPTGGPAVVYDIAERTNGRFISFAPPVDAANRFWREIGSGWEVTPTDLSPGFTENLLAASDGGALYALYPLGGRHLNYSFDNGNHFTESSWPVDHPNVVTSISAGIAEDMPLYIAGHDNAETTGKLQRWNVPVDNGAHWFSNTVEFGPIRKIVADPVLPDVVWAHIDEASSLNPTFQLLTYNQPYMPPAFVLGQSKLWSVSNDYGVRDIRVAATSETHRIVDLTIQTPYSNAQDIDHTVIKRWEFDITGPDIPLPVYLGGTWIVTGVVTIEANDTVNLEPGSVMKFAPDAQLLVVGTLIADQATFKKIEAGQSSAWEGIFVTGSATITNCIIDGAETGIETHKASHIVLDGCTITNCGTGLVAYQPSGTGEPSLTDCQINGNKHDGSSLLANANTLINQCEFSGNGGTGLVMMNSYAKISSSAFIGNGNGEGGYGLLCFGSSPLLACNDFQSNQKGELALYNQSYPVLDTASAGGLNSFFNDTQNLIDMWDSYPLTEGGHNNFTVGSTGYFMADMSASPLMRYICGNFWNPSLTLATLYPSSLNVYKWTSTDPTANSCGSSSGVGSNATQQMFASAMAAQASGDYVASSALLSDLIEQYPDSVWAAPSVAQLFANQCLIGDGFDGLQDELIDLSQANEESILGVVAGSFATRLYVEDEEFAPAVETYTSNLAEATSATDSMFAEVDLAITAFRADGGGGSLDQMNVAGIHEVFRQMDALAGHTPSSPTASHSGYAAIPNTISLEANFPNPFNAETTIRYYLPEAQFAVVSIFNIVGQRVATLVSGQMSAGFHDVHWSGSDLASGVYLYQLKAGGAVETMKMVLLK